MGEPSLTIYGDVGPVTGDVLHDADVRITGSVLPGFRVETTGKVVISGNVRDGHVIADGDIGVYGIASGPDALLDSAGTVAVRHAADLRVQAGRDVVIRALAERAHLVAGRRVLFAGPPGLLRGGSVRAGWGLEVGRIEAEGDRDVEIVVGLSPFDQPVEQLAERLTFARDRGAAAVMREVGTPEDYLRQVREADAYRSLAVSLERRLAQVEAAEPPSQPPYLRVTGRGPVGAKVRLGEVGDALRTRNGRGEGPFRAVVNGGEVAVRPLEEAPCVG